MVQLKLSGDRRFGLYSTDFDVWIFDRNGNQIAMTKTKPHDTVVDLISMPTYIIRQSILLGLRECYALYDVQQCGPNAYKVRKKICSIDIHTRDLYNKIKGLKVPSPIQDFLINLF